MSNTETKTMTVKDILEDVYNTLKGIKVTIDEMDEIGIPLRRGLSGIKICVDALNRAAEESASKETAEQESQVTEEEAPVITEATD